MKTNNPSRTSTRSRRFGAGAALAALPDAAAAPHSNVMLSSKSAWAQLRRFAVKALVIALSAFVLTSCPTPIGTVTNFTGSSTGTVISAPWGIAAGPDGNLWFTNYNNNSIGRITPAGVVSSFTDPSISGPYGIAAGPDGNLWFTNSGVGPYSLGGSIGRITPAGVVSNFTDPSISNPNGIAAGPDGGMWFTNYNNNSIGRITAVNLP